MIPSYTLLGVIRMKRRMNLRKRKKHHISLGFLLFFFLVAFFVVLSKLSCVNIPLSNDDLLRGMLKESNHHMPYSYDKKNVVTSVMSFFSHIDLEKPFTILDSTYRGLVDIPYDDVSDEELEKLKNTSSYIEDKGESSSLPLVYIYNTHQLETYSGENLREYNVTPNVMMASYILREKLNHYHIPAMVETNDVTEILHMNNWNYASSYQVTKMFMLDAKEKYPSIKYYIDLHRDSARRSVTYREINGVGYARILFLVGLENPSYDANLKLAEALHQKLEAKWPGLSRGIYKKEGPGVDGVYNQDVSPYAMLVEMGGVDNTIEEVLHSTEVLAEILYDYIGDLT